MEEKMKPESARNPYAPPAAAVADVMVREVREPRPAQVSWAVGLFWLDLVLSVLQAGLGWRREQEFLSNLLTAGLSALFFALEAWVILRIHAGRNWARWVALVSVAVGVPLAFMTLAQTSFRDVALDVAATGADVIALYLIFLSPGRRWFRRQVA